MAAGGDAILAARPAGAGAGGGARRAVPSKQNDLPPLHKDFYYNHPEPALQCEEFGWGNLEVAHPVLGPRTSQEVAAYREEHGISVHVVRGRQPPKPFQAFSETSFPAFVEDVARELFSAEAVPFPVQAQAWPCALAGMDVVAVAPTGSGKTLAFFLPALVHIMAQEPLRRGEGPIALVLSPTRELAQQTWAIADRFCKRTSGEDTIRVGAVYGGIDASMQVPEDGAPDFGRWPELLIATPGRLWELLSRRRWIQPQRISYVVLDEADELLSPRGWLPQVRQSLALMRPDRQLLMLSATWPEEAEEASRELCGCELVRIRVDPAVPPIPQEIRLFPGLEGDAAFSARRQALQEWLSKELAADESVLVLCGARNVASSLANDDALAEAAAGKGAEAEAALALLDGSNEERRSAYWRFVRGQTRVLVSSFALGSRGLDYADTAAGICSPDAAPPLSLVVLLFDFPSTLKDYAHCIGRTQRPGHRAGRVVAFLPELRFWIGRELAALLEHCGQKVPRELDELIVEDRAFCECVREAMVRMRDGQPPWLEDGPGPLHCRGDFDVARKVWLLPAHLPSYRRKLLHWLADEIGLAHVSAGQALGERRLHLALSRDALPDKFFIEGEEVAVAAAGLAAAREGRQRFEGRTADVRASRPAQGEQRGIVVDPRIHRKSRTVRVRFHGSRDEFDVLADYVRPLASDTA